MATNSAALAPWHSAHAEKLPASLDRRFEALVFDWDGTAVPDRAADATVVRRLVEDACALGLHAAVVSGTNVRNIDGQLAARPRGPGRLYLLLNRGSEVFHVGPNGPRLLHRRRATRAERSALAGAAARLAAELEHHGLAVAIVADRLNRQKVDLIPDPAWSDPPKERIDELLAAVEDRLARHGLGGLSTVLELAQRAAREAGLPDARVTTDAKHVEIGLTDKSDSARWIAGELARWGIGPRLVLVLGDEFGPLGGGAGSDALMLVPELGRATSVSVGAEPAGVPPGVVHLGGGPAEFTALLGDQIERRRRGDVPEIDLDPAWTLQIEGFDPQLERVREALLCIADGCIGTRGSLVVENAAALPLVLASGLYDGYGPAEELMPCPLWAKARTRVPERFGVRRALDLRTGLLRQELRLGGDVLEALLFSSPTRPGLAVLRTNGGLPRSRPIQALELPGTRKGGIVRELPDGLVHAALRADPEGGVVAGAVDDHGPERLDRVAAYAAGSRRLPGADVPRRRLEAISTPRFETLLTEHRRAWARRWEDAEIVIEGDSELEFGARFALFHLLASVAEKGETALGARGLSGPGYRGHVFWDADVFCLPTLAATCPEAARTVLEYRRRRLPAAVDYARATGHEGARFPWESAREGVDVTPPTGLDLNGETVPIRTGDLEEHVTADVAWAASLYLDWTADDAFAPVAREFLIATARYWASRISLDAEGRGHIETVIGPDEYHEPVDDNAFTNVMARWNLRRAAQEDGVSPSERSRWLALADALVDGYDAATGVYEQFAGFFALEPLLIAEFAPRRPIVADVLLGRERVARAQVLKQADVLMLHHLVPGEVVPGSLVANLDFYEPRTAHGSSLSPGIHASLLARAGRLEEAVHWLRLASRIDLDDIGGSTAHGLHLAAMGSVWQALAFGFLGLRADGPRLELDPQLPPAWRALEMRVRFRGASLRVRAEHERALVWGHPQALITLPGGPQLQVTGREPTVLERRGATWSAR
jgi:trehalose/maltose hydrolase-like predicted phosphorylase